MTDRNLIEHVARAIDPQAWKTAELGFSEIWRRDAMRMAEVAIAAVREWEKANEGK